MFGWFKSRTRKHTKKDKLVVYIPTDAPRFKPRLCLQHNTSAPGVPVWYEVLGMFSSKAKAHRAGLQVLHGPLKGLGVLGQLDNE